MDASVPVAGEAAITQEVGVRKSTTEVHTYILRGRQVLHAAVMEVSYDGRKGVMFGAGETFPRAKRCTGT